MRRGRKAYSLSSRSGLKPESTAVSHAPEGLEVQVPDLRRLQGRMAGGHALAHRDVVHAVGAGTERIEPLQRPVRLRPGPGVGEQDAGEQPLRAAQPRDPEHRRPARPGRTAERGRARRRGTRRRRGRGRRRRRGSRPRCYDRTPGAARAVAQPQDRLDQLVAGEGLGEHGSVPRPLRVAPAVERGMRGDGDPRGALLPAPAEARGRASSGRTRPSPACRGRRGRGRARLPR